MKPIEAPIPKFLAASGHKGIVYREPYGVTLIMGSTKSWKMKVSVRFCLS
jgi:hypothetical protein